MQYGNENIMEETIVKIKNHYDNEKFYIKNVFKISKETTKEDELFDYIGANSYLKTKENNRKSVVFYIC